MQQKLFRVVVLISLLAGLFGGSQASALGGEPTAPTGTVTLWHAYSDGTAEGDALAQVIAAAEAANPGLNIVPEFHTFDTIYSDYEAAVLAGGGPDMYVAPNDPLGDEVRMGVILNIDSYLTGRLANVSQVAIDGMKVNGLMYGVPESAKAVALYYNTNAVPTPPATTAELLSMVQGGKTFAGGWIGYFLYGFFAGFGGQLMQSNGYCIADQGGYVPALQYFLQLQTAGAVIHVGVDDNGFPNGIYDMYVGGPWSLKDFEESPLGQSGHIGVAVLPAGPSSPARPFTGIDGFFVNPHTSNPANVVETALYMTNQASSQIFTNVGGHVPVRSDVSSSDPLVTAFAQAADQGEPRPQSAQFSTYWGAFGDMWGDVMGGLVTPAVGVKASCKRMNYENGFSVADTLTSASAFDGWVLESTEFSGVGGTRNAAATTFNLGDDALDRQYRAILSFNTSALPDDAVITKVVLKVKKQGLAGTNPFTTHGNILIDIKKPAFSTSSALQIADFQAAPNRAGIGTIKNLPLKGAWYQAALLTTATPYINKLGVTQFRLRFTKDDNDDRGADYLKFYSGNAPATYRPVLVITYHRP